MLEKVEVVLHEPNGPGDYLWTFTGKNLLEVLTMNGYQIGGYCAGQGSCGKCKVRLAGKVNPLTTSELQHLLPSEIKLGYRLACCCTVQGPLKVFIDFQDTGISKKPLGRTINTKRESRVETRKVFIPGIDIDSPVTLYSRLAKALPGYQIKLGIDNLNELSKMDRIGRPALELNALILDQRTVIYIGRDECGAYGVALDLGTTSLFSALVNLQTGVTVAIDSKPNMQRIYGADIVSRLSYCMEHSEGLKTLQKVLVNTINSMIEGMCREVKVDQKRIFQLSIVGNPVMLHFLMGLNSAGLAASPYIGLFEDEYVYNAQEIGLNTGNNAELVILPQVGGFIGADTIACLITLPSVSSERFLLLDIGTNGEIVIGNKGRFWAASAAAGPAFEGASITCGMRAEDGAIDKVYITADGKLQYNCLGSGRLAKGLCGSAIIDITAALLKGGYLDHHGTIKSTNSNHPEIRQGENGLEVVVVNQNDSWSGATIVFNQSDIRQFQMAMSAIKTAIEILLECAKVHAEMLDKIYLAGSFGNYINPESAIITGLLPPVEPGKVVNIGNAAAQGAAMTLIYPEKHQEARELKTRIKYIELAKQPDFQERYLKNLDFQ